MLKMIAKRFAPVAISVLLLASPIAMAAGAQQTEAATVPAAQPAAEEAPEAAMAPGMAMGSPGTTGGQQDQPSGMTLGRGGMMPGGKGCKMGMGMMGDMQDADRAGGMNMGRCGMMRGGMGCKMGKEMAGRMQRDEDDQGEASMGMMHGAMGCMTRRGDNEGCGMPERYRQLMGRLDLLEARMAKIEAMLERLLQR